MTEVSATDFGICNFGRKIVSIVDNLETTDGTSLIFKADITKGKPCDTVTFSLTSPFCKDVIIARISPAIKNRSELDFNPLPDLLLLSLLILLFSRDGKYEEHLRALREKVVEVFLVVPVHRLFVFGNPWAEFILSVDVQKAVDALSKAPCGLIALNDYKEQVRIAKDNNCEVKPYWSILDKYSNSTSFAQEVFDNGDKNSFSFLDILANAMDNANHFYTPRNDLSPDTHISHMLHESIVNLDHCADIGSKLEGAAKTMSPEDINAMTIERFRRLEKSMDHLKLIPAPLKEIMKEQEGTVSTSMDNVLILVRDAIRQFLETVVTFTDTVTSRIVPSQARSAAAAIYGYSEQLLVYRKLPYFLYPSFNCTTEVRKAVCEKLQYETFPCTKIVGDEECAVVNALNASSYYLGREKELVEAHNLKPFPDNICRIKLSVLSYELRNILRGLPISVFSGLSKSGKTALREFMISASTGNVDSIFLKSRYKNVQRTVIPQLVHIRDKQKPFFVLDTVGDDTDATLKSIFGKINEILACWYIKSNSYYIH